MGPHGWPCKANHLFWILNELLPGKIAAPLVHEQGGEYGKDAPEYSDQHCRQTGCSGKGQNCHFGCSVFVLTIISSKKVYQSKDSRFPYIKVTYLTLNKLRKKPGSSKSEKFNAKCMPIDIFSECLLIKIKVVSIRYRR